jgi:hypothetical protein
MNRRTVFWICVTLLGVSCAFQGCAAVNKARASRAEDLLSAAGFVPKQPVTPEDLSRLEKAEPLKLVRTTRDGKTLYVYPDPYNCKCVFVGSEKEYQEYRRLVEKKRLQDESIQVQQMQDFGYPGGPLEDFWWR